MKDNRNFIPDRYLKEPSLTEETSIISTGTEAGTRKDGTGVKWK